MGFVWQEMETLQPPESPKGECENLGMGGGVRGQSQNVEVTLGGTVPRDEREPGALLGESQVGSVGERGGRGGEGHGERRDHVVRPGRPWKPWQGDEAKTPKRLPPRNGCPDSCSGKTTHHPCTLPTPLRIPFQVPK